MSTSSHSEPHPPEKVSSSPTLQQPDREASKADEKLLVQPANPGPLADEVLRRRGPRPERRTLPKLHASQLLVLPRRRWGLPLVLFLATCLSTFWVGAANWRPRLDQPAGELLQTVAVNWQQGLIYMGAVLAILLTHEMGHFLQTVRYHIPASYPLCIPVPFSLIGTMGAVISMDGMRANRKQIFDIGIAGPLAGLVVAAPILYVGIR